MISAVVTAEERPDSDTRHDQRTRHVERWGWAGVIGVLLASVTLAVLFVGGVRAPTSSGKLPAWREDLSFAVTMVAFVLVVVALVLMVRARMFTAARGARALSRSLSIGQRRQVGRWIRRGEAAPHDMAQATAASAEEMARQRKMMLFYAGFVLMMIGSALGATNPWRLMFMVVIAVVMVVSAVLVHRDANLAQRWLDTRSHPITSEAAGS